MTTNRHITETERAQWASMAHLALLQCIGDAVPWSIQDYAFHGGTSLHLNWNSPRFSEDLDFLLSTRVAVRLKSVMAIVGARLQETLLLTAPPLTVTITDMSTARIGNFRVTLTRPGILGAVQVKAGFWLVPPTYFENYQATLRTPGIPANLGGARIRVDTLLPAATIESAYYDKLTAFATRSHLKWRDLFDFWWIDQQLPDEVAETPSLARVKGHLRGYDTAEGLSPSAALRRFAAMLTDRTAVIAAADLALKPFVSPSMWTSIRQATLGEMVDLARTRTMRLATLLEVEALTPLPGTGTNTGASGS